jgi:hypothetical protein
MLAPGRGLRKGSSRIERNGRYGVIHRERVYAILMCVPQQSYNRNRRDRYFQYTPKMQPADQGRQATPQDQLQVPFLLELQMAKGTAF